MSAQAHALAGMPWWAERARALLLQLDTLADLELGELWGLEERLSFLWENVEPALLLLDFEARPELREVWSELQRRAPDSTAAREAAGREVTERLRSGSQSPEDFRSHWESLGFAQVPGSAGTPADDWLDGLLQMPRLTLGEDRVPFGQMNMASRALRIADFLEVVRPGPDDRLVDIGCGSGKVALTLAASCRARVTGVEYDAGHVQTARAHAERLGLSNLTLVHADARTADLSEGTAFYLYYPFYGEVAQVVAARLGALARTRKIVIYASGPHLQYAEHFLAQVDEGALRLVERRGEMGEVMVLRSASGG